MRRTPRDLEQLKKKLGTTGGSGTGDVVGPSSSTTEQLTVFNGTTGKEIKGSSLTGIIKATAGVSAAATEGDADLILPDQTGQTGKFLKTDGTNASWSNPAGSGDVTGPGSSTADDLVLFNDNTGKVIKDSGKKIGAASGVASLNASTKVVEDPANATATPAGSKIVISDAGGKVDSWVTDASTIAKGKAQLATDGGTTAGTVVQASDGRLAKVLTLSASFVDVSGSYVALSASFVDVSGSLSALNTSYLALSASFVDISGALSNTISTLASLSASFVDVSGSFSTLNTSYLALSASFVDVSGSVVSTASTLSSLSASFVDVSGSFSSLNTSYLALSASFVDVSGSVTSTASTLSSLSASFVDVSGAFSSTTINTLVPSQTGKSGSYLYSNGTSVLWHTVVTSSITIGQIAARAVGGL